MGRSTKKVKKRAKPSPQVIEALCNEMTAAGEHPSTGSEANVKEWLQKHAEKELWFFARWILGNDHLGLGTYHRTVMCPFLTDFSRSYLKLLMVPMGHLKTTVASRSMPLHVQVQPAAANLYHAGMPGYNMRVLLANENEQKSKENLYVIQQHCEQNVWLPWLWPNVFWDEKSQSPRWTDSQIELKRTQYWAEANISAVGIKTGFIGKYFDMIIGDDIAALEASQNPPLMDRCRKWRSSAKTRFYDKRRRMFIGVGTHWGSNDVYVDWKKDPDVDILIESVVRFDEDTKQEVPLWPEKFPLDIIDNLRKGMDPIEWALWYMNKPVPSGYTALNWNDLREYHMSGDGREIYFEDSKMDERITQRSDRIAKNLGFVLGSAKYDPANGKPRTRPPRGMDNDFYEHMRTKYPEKVKDADGTVQ